MRVLFATHDGADYLASALWNGLQEVLGATGVFDAGCNQDFHAGEGVRTTNRYLTHSPVSRRCLGHEKGFDLLVLNSCFQSQHDWHWAINLTKRLRPGGKIAFVEGGDDARDVTVPPFPVTHVFRRELEEGFSYPYECSHLTFAVPRGMVTDPLNSCLPRDIDVFFAGGAGSHPWRWEMLRHLFNTEPFTFVLSQQATRFHLSYDLYLDFLRRSKIALCPLGGGTSECVSTMHLYETMACGAIPILVGMKPRVQDPPLPAGAWNVCYNLGELPGIVRGLLGQNLEPRRAQMLQEVARNHTTAARATRLLEKVGLR